jgi:hypothetical protein
MHDFEKRVTHGALVKEEVSHGNNLSVRLSLKIYRTECGMLFTASVSCEIQAPSELSLARCTGVENLRNLGASYSGAQNIFGNEPQKLVSQPDKWYYIVTINSILFNCVFCFTINCSSRLRTMSGQYAHECSGAFVREGLTMSSYTASESKGGEQGQSPICLLFQLVMSLTKA